MNVRRAPLPPLLLTATGGALGKGSVLMVSAFAASAFAVALGADTPLVRWSFAALAAMLAASALVCAHWVRRCAQLESERGRAALREQRDTARWLEAAELASLARFEWLPDGNRWWGDAALYRLLGLPATSLPSSTGLLQRHVDADDLARVQQMLQDALAPSGRLDLHFRLRREDGGQRLVHARARLLAGGDGHAAARLVGVISDVTEARRTADELRLARFALDAVDQPVSAVDEELNYRLTNKAWFRVTGVSPRHQGNIHFSHVFPLVTSEERREAFAACARDRVERVVQSHNPAAPHSGRRFETRYIPFDDAHVSWRGIVMVSRDVTGDTAPPVGAA